MDKLREEGTRISKKIACGSKSINKMCFLSLFKPAPMLIAQVIFPTPPFLID